MTIPHVDKRRTVALRTPGVANWPGVLGRPPRYSLPGIGMIANATDKGCQLDHACPGCGLVDSLQVGFSHKPPGTSWFLMNGDKADPTSWTLTPSINATCCGWHGHLKDGVWYPC